VTLPLRIEINGRWREGIVEPRRTLADYLREDLNLTGTHLACEHGFCGNCNVLLDGQTVRSCLMFAIQAQGRSIQTVEGLADPAGKLNALQCGFCTPAMLLTAQEFLRDRPGETSTEAIREAISGVTCRCTGYQQIVEAIRSVAAKA
jgi:carbon-monoxide dehydrogenase small subunit